MNYRLEKVINEGLVLLFHTAYGRQMWHTCTVRKRWECNVSGKYINSGEKAWRPITNGYNRMHRISNLGMARLSRVDDAQHKTTNGER